MCLVSHAIHVLVCNIVLAAYIVHVFVVQLHVPVFLKALIKVMPYMLVVHISPPFLSLPLSSCQGANCQAKNVYVEKSTDCPGDLLSGNPLGNTPRLQIAKQVAWKICQEIYRLSEHISRSLHVKLIGQSIDCQEIC